MRPGEDAGPLCLRRSVSRPASSVGQPCAMASRLDASSLETQSPSMGLGFFWPPGKMADFARAAQW